jgi:hypothetical protein
MKRPWRCLLLNMVFNAASNSSNSFEAGQEIIFPLQIKLPIALDDSYRILLKMV